MSIGSDSIEKLSPKKVTLAAKQTVKTVHLFYRVQITGLKPRCECDEDKLPTDSEALID